MTGVILTWFDPKLKICVLLQYITWYQVSKIDRSHREKVIGQTQKTCAVLRSHLYVAS